MADPAPADPATDRSILIVEDNDRFAETLGSELRDRGYAVQRAHDLGSLDAIKDLDVQYAVVDLRLGADSGLDAIQKILPLNTPISSIAFIEERKAVLLPGSSLDRRVRLVDLDQRDPRSGCCPRRARHRPRARLEAPEWLIPPLPKPPTNDPS